MNLQDVHKLEHGLYRVQFNDGDQDIALVIVRAISDPREATRAFVNLRSLHASVSAKPRLDWQFIASAAKLEVMDPDQVAAARKQLAELRVELDIEKKVRATADDELTNVKKNARRMVDDKVKLLEERDALLFRIEKLEEDHAEALEARSKERDESSEDRDSLASVCDVLEERLDRCEVAEFERVMREVIK
jgi:hypothetical protein